MLERETGDLYIYEDFEELGLVVEEFRDVLDEEFGFVTSMEKARFEPTFLRVMETCQRSQLR